MIKVEILGTGCMKCNKLFNLTKQVVEENKIEAEVIKVNDIQKIIERGVMITPGLVINGEIKSVGKIPSLQDLKKMIIS